MTVTFTLGQELMSVTQISNLQGGWHEGVNRPVAGEFYALGIDGQGVSGKQLERVKKRMEIVKTQLEAKQFEGLSKEGLVGEMLYAAALGYFAANDVNLSLLNRTGPILAYRHPSFGTISTDLETVYSFGIPRQVKMSGIMVDMDAVAQSLWAKNNDAQLSRLMGQQVGMMLSALEHRIPELFFTSKEYPGEAVSAVKALAMASAQGQRIYQVSAKNVEAVLPLLKISEEVKREIEESVAVGKVVTVSQGEVTVGGWKGVGYIVSDPETGGGAYRIGGGGENGGKIVGVMLGSLYGLSMIFNPKFVVSPLVVLGLFVATTFLYHAITIDLIMYDKHGGYVALDYASFFIGAMSIVLGIPAIATAAGIGGMTSVYLAILAVVISIVSSGVNYE